MHHDVEVEARALVVLAEVTRGVGVGDGLLRLDRMLASAYVRKLAPEADRLVISLNLLPHLRNAGVLGGPELHAADLQIGTSLCLLMTLQDLRPAIASRPAGELAMRVDPDYPGDAPPILPPAWLPGLRAEQAVPAQ